MGRGKLYILTALSLCIVFSCDLGEFNEVEEVKVVSNARFLLPLAYGEITLGTLIGYSGYGTGNVEINEDGYYVIDYGINEFEMTDTINFAGDLLESISQFELRIETENRIPLGIRLTLKFCDSINYTQFGPDFVIDFVTPPEMNSEGIAIEASKNIEDVYLTNEQMEEYKKASRLILSIYFYLPERQSRQILSHPSDFFMLNVGAVVKLGENQTE
ncbi:MAG: hypothetical protein JW798_17995 [Prolixibacteraceae bacterium]|nr:hypothetical protein [Prolixibacteraceae bacterium]